MGFYANLHPFRMIDCVYGHVLANIRYHLNNWRLDLREVDKHFLEYPRHSAHLAEVGYVHRAILRRYKIRL